MSRLRSFLGTTNYFRCFIRRYAEVVRPLNNWLKADTAFVLSEDCQAAFTKVKQLLTTAPVLVLPDWRSHTSFTMICDASYEGIGGVLLQNQRPLAFESRSLSKSEEHYSPTDLEMLAIVHCCKTWRVYIEGRDVNVYTDHKPNITFDTVTMTNRRHARWLDALQGHRLIWHYMKGVSNPADSLSRNPVCFVSVALAGPLQFVGLVQALPSPSVKLQDSLSFIEKVKTAYAADPWYASATNTASLSFKAGLYYNGTALALPANAELQTAAIAECHDTPYTGHVGLTKTLEIVRRFFWWPTGMAGAVRRYI